MSGRAEIELKGQAFKGFMGAVTRLFGELEARRLVAALPEPLRSTYEHGGLVAGGWYPIAWYRAFYAAAHEALPGESRLPQRISYEATRSDLAGIYRFVLRFVSPNVLMGQAPRIFGLYTRGGRVVVRENVPGSAILSYEDCHGFDRVLWEDLVAGTEATLDTTRVERMATTILEGGGNDDARMVVRLRWSVTAGPPG